jgi:hypothetical protein
LRRRGETRAALKDGVGQGARLFGAGEFAQESRDNLLRSVVEIDFAGFVLDRDPHAAFAITLFMRRPVGLPARRFVTIENVHNRDRHAGIRQGACLDNLQP